MKRNILMINEMLSLSDTNGLKIRLLFTRNQMKGLILQGLESWKNANIDAR